MRTSGLRRTPSGVRNVYEATEDVQCCDLRFSYTVVRAGCVSVIRGGPGQRAFSVPECPVLRERTSESARFFRRRYPPNSHNAARSGHLPVAVRSHLWAFSRYVDLTDKDLIKISFIT